MATDARLRRAPLFQAFPTLALTALIAALVASLCAALLFAVRRVAGEQGVASLPAMLASAVVLALGAAALRIALARLLPARKWRFYLLAAPGLALLLSAVALTSPQASAVGLIALWLAVAASEWWSWRLAGYGLSAPAQRLAAVVQPVAQPAAEAAVSPSSLSAPAAVDVASDDLVSQHSEPQHELQHELPPGVIQRLERTGQQDREIVTMMMRVDLSPKQRLATLNVSFCPPLASRPEVTAEVVEGPDATLQVEQAETYGARLELRLSESSDARQEAIVQLYAVAVTTS